MRTWVGISLVAAVASTLSCSQPPLTTGVTGGARVAASSATGSTATSSLPGTATNGGTGVGTSAGGTGSGAAGTGGTGSAQVTSTSGTTGSVVSAGCADAGTSLGGFQVDWSDQPPSLTVWSSDCRTLLSSHDLFETQTNTATFQELLGSFLVSEADAGWNEPLSLAAQSVSSQRITLRVAQSGGHTGTITLASPAPSVLAITLTSDGQNRIRSGFGCLGSDHFLGFGAQTDAIDHYGHKVPIWISEPGVGKTSSDDPDPNGLWYVEGTRHQASYPLPVFLSGRGFAFVSDDTVRQVFDLCDADPSTWTVETWDSTVTYKIYDGPLPAAAIERLTADTGRQPLANDLVFAPWNDAIFGSANVLSIAKQLRAAKIPSGALWTEDYRGGGMVGNNYQISENWGVDATLYPNIQQLAAQLHAQGFRFLAYNNTFLGALADAEISAVLQGVEIQNPEGQQYTFTGDDGNFTSMVDLTNANGPAFVEGWLQTLAGDGFDGWMSDFGEWLPADAALAGGQDAVAYHNTYPRAYHAVSAQTFADLQMAPNTSVYLARSGTLRDAPNQPVVWGGDQLTSFDPNDGYPTALTRGLNLGLAGIALYGSDIGGYQNNFGPASTKELYFRWTTLGALSPVMRTHHGTWATLNWAFNSDAETTAHFARWSQFHTQLWPYLRYAAQQAHDHGLPIMQVLPLAYPQDPAVWHLSDEYLFGPSLLVAPVLVEGATSRNVYFPTDNWLPVWGGASVQGPTVQSVDLPMTEIGLYARAGAILPMLPTRLDTLMPADPDAGLVTLDEVRYSRVLRVFGGANGAWTDLDGTTYTLTSANNDLVTAVKVEGVALGSCSLGGMPCADIDTTARSVTVQGTGLTSIELDSASGSSSVAVKGATGVEEVLYRF